MEHIRDIIESAVREALDSEPKEFSCSCGGLMFRVEVDGFLLSLICLECNDYSTFKWFD